LQLLTGLVQPYALSILASAAVAKTTMVYPLPPITDIGACYRAVKLLSQRLRLVGLVALASTVINTALISHSQHKAATLVYNKMTEESFFIS